MTPSLHTSTPIPKQPGAKEGFIIPNHTSSTPQTDSPPSSFSAPQQRAAALPHQYAAKQPAENILLSPSGFGLAHVAFTYSSY